MDLLTLPLTDRATIINLPRPRILPVDLLALRAADLVRRQQFRMNMAGWSNMQFVNAADFSAHASSDAEGTLLGGNIQPVLPPNFFDQGNRGVGRAIRIRAHGVLSTTGTPTLVFKVRIGSTAGTTDYNGTVVGINSAITTQSGVSTKQWDLELVLVCRAIGVGSGNTTLAGAGRVSSPSGFASPFTYALQPGTPESATWTATINCALQNYINLTATWSANSASNTITCKHLTVECLD